MLNPKDTIVLGQFSTIIFYIVLTSYVILTFKIVSYSILILHFLTHFKGFLLVLLSPGKSQFYITNLSVLNLCAILKLILWNI